MINILYCDYNGITYGAAFTASGELAYLKLLPSGLWQVDIAGNILQVKENEIEQLLEGF